MEAGGTVSLTVPVSREPCSLDSDFCCRQTHTTAPTRTLNVGWLELRFRRRHFCLRDQSGASARRCLSDIRPHRARLPAAGGCWCSRSRHDRQIAPTLIDVPRLQVLHPSCAHGLLVAESYMGCDWVWSAGTNRERDSASARPHRPQPFSHRRAAAARLASNPNAQLGKSPEQLGVWLVALHCSTQEDSTACRCQRGTAAGVQLPGVQLPPLHRLRRRPACWCRARGLSCWGP